VVTRVALKDELLDAQLLRAVGASPYGGSDVGECLGLSGEVCLVVVIDQGGCAAWLSEREPRRGERL
jgi:hypothetical protein